MQIEGKVILLWRRIALLSLCSVSLLTYVILQIFIPPLLTLQPFFMMLTVLIIFYTELWVSERLSHATLTERNINVTIAYCFGVLKTKKCYIPTTDFILQVKLFIAKGVKTIGFPYLDQDNHCKIIFHLGKER